MTNKPKNYPNTANSGIYDAQAFSVGDSEIVHAPNHYPDGNKIVAKCGVYGFATERPSRITTWRNSNITCQRCQQ